MKTLLIMLLLIPNLVFSQDGSLLADRNGDGQVKILAFGDSITYGVGDTEEKGGYTTRLSNLLGVTVVNAGDPGEGLCGAGVFRFVDVVSRSDADIVILYEGSNDGFSVCGDGTFERLVQRMVNVTSILNKELLLLTLPPPCCNHVGLGHFMSIYSSVIRSVADLNELTLVDLDKAYSTSCDVIPQCKFLNQPDGLHPNGLGYDLIAQMIAASLLDIDVFALDGASKLESALSLKPGSVLIKPVQTEGQL